MALVCTTYSSNNVGSLTRALNTFKETEKYSKLVQVVHAQDLKGDQHQMQIWFEDGRHMDNVWKREFTGDSYQKWSGKIIK